MIPLEEAFPQGEPDVMQRSHIDHICSLTGKYRFNDIIITADNPILVAFGDDWYRIGTRPLEVNEIFALVDSLYMKGASAAMLGGQEQIFKLPVAVSRTERINFRCIATSSNCRDFISRSGHIVMRALPSKIPSLDDMGLEADLIEALRPRSGLVVVVGKTNSGKTWLLGSVIGSRLMTERMHVLFYENPCELNYRTVEPMLGVVHQIEIPRDLATYSDAVGNALRQAANAVVYGEARDKPTIAGALDAAETGQAVYTTAHANGVADTPLRLASPFGPEAAPIVLQKISNQLKVVVFQRLFKRLGGQLGARYACREYLIVDEDIRTDLLKTPADQFASRMRYWLEEKGQTMERSITRARDGGFIDPVAANIELKWLAATKKESLHG